MERVEIQSNVFLDLISIGTYKQIDQFIVEVIDKSLNNETELILDDILQRNEELMILRVRLLESKRLIKHIFL